MHKINLNWLWLSLAVIVADQITKMMVVKHIILHGGIKVLPFFMLVHVRNYGAAFNFLDVVGGWQRWLFIIIPIIVCIVVLVWLLRAQYRPWLSVALALIFGGALGNLYGRIIHGYVIDFLYFHMGQYAWPAFNIADSAVCVGAFILLIQIIIRKDWT